MLLDVSTLNRFGHVHHQDRVAVPDTKNKGVHAAARLAMIANQGPIGAACDVIHLAPAAERRAITPGIVDVEAVKKANDALIETINDTLTIAEQGKKARADAAVQLADAEQKLKNALLEGAKRQANMRSA